MAKLSPVFNDAQFINGIPAVGAQVFTYAAGSSTKLTTYTDEAGTVPQSNPIILNARGEPTNGPIWLTEGQSYKFVFTSSTDTDPPTSPIRTIDNVVGVNDASLTIDQWIDSGVTPTYVSATQFTLPGDQTSAFQENRRIKATVTAGTVYGYISVSVFGALTTVTVVLDSGSLDSGLSAVSLGLITPNRTSLPQIPSFVTTSMLQDESVTSAKLADDAFITIVGTSKNLIITNNSGTPNSQVDIDADEIILQDNNKRAYLASSVNLTANIATSGANGLDTGSEASSTWYYLWVIYNGTTVASLISASSTAPTLPSGYTYKALVGAIYNDGSSNFIKIRQVANKVAYEANRTIVDGAVTTLAWTSISVAAFFPPTAKSIQIAGAEQFGISHRSDGMGGSYFLSGNAGTSRTFSVFPTARNAFNTGECLYASSIYYFIVATPGTLLATGWEY